MARIDLGGNFRLGGITTDTESLPTDAASIEYVDNRPGATAIEVYFNEDGTTTSFEDARDALNNASPRVMYDGTNFRNLPTTPAGWSQTSASNTRFIGRTNPPENATDPLTFVVLPAGAAGADGPAGPVGPFRVFAYFVHDSTGTDPIPTAGPTAGHYDRTTEGVVSLAPTGWVADFPTLGTGEVLYTSFATYTAADDTGANPDPNATSGWSPAFLITDRGPAGLTGDAFRTITVYRVNTDPVNGPARLTAAETASAVDLTTGDVPATGTFGAGEWTNIANTRANREAGTYLWAADLVIRRPNSSGNWVIPTGNRWTLASA